MEITTIGLDLAKSIFQVYGVDATGQVVVRRSVGLSEFLCLEIPAREMLLNPILSERSLSMLYAPRGLGKSWLALSIGLAVASGSRLLRWSAPHKQRVLYVDGEMPLVALQERLQVISAAASDIANDGFQLLAADYVESGINLSDEEGQQAVEALLPETDLLILDNLSTLCSGRSENASDAWLPMQQWLLGFDVRVWPFCSSIMLETMAVSVVLRAGKTLSIR